jgi:hypothetical protein
MMRVRLAVSIALALSPATLANARDRDANSLERMMSGGPILDPAELALVIAEADKHPLGSAKNPVRAATPTGQRAYLATLRCSDGRTPTFQRTGNVGPGIYESIVDLYVVNCGAATPGKVEVRMDMYHPGHIETRPVPGFSIEAAPVAASIVPKI